MDKWLYISLAIVGIAFFASIAVVASNENYNYTQLQIAKLHCKN